MSGIGFWQTDFSKVEGSLAEGLVPVRDFSRYELQPEQVAVMEAAVKYGADAVLFEADRNGRTGSAQAFVFYSDGPPDDPEFARLHRRLWSWGGVPLVYRKTRGLVQLFRCAHKPDFVSPEGYTVCCPVETLEILHRIETDLFWELDPWWDVERLHNGTLWDDPRACKLLLRADKAAHKSLIVAVTKLHFHLKKAEVLPRHVQRKLLILSLLIAYLEERGVFPDGYFGNFQKGARRFFQVLGDGRALVSLLADLEKRFNGNVFAIPDDERDSLIDNPQLRRFALLVQGQQEDSGQLTLWQLYSFKDLPVELISHIYQLFVDNADTSIYTPPFLVRLMLDEVLGWEKLEQLHAKKQVILDPSCGSGIFLVEAYKRLVLHWRARNDWKRPSASILKKLLGMLRGVDLEAGAIEVAAFSLCLALCDSLEPSTIRASVKLFPPLAGETLHHSCFFRALDLGLIKDEVGVVVGNPPFQSALTTDEAKSRYRAVQSDIGNLADKQIAYLFLHDAMEMLADGGVLCMLQQYNFLYNLNSQKFRHDFFGRWNVREVLDFVSVRGLFKKGSADTKVIVVVAEASAPIPNEKVLHATFRRSGRADAQQSFDIDHYDLHWLPRKTILESDSVWKSDLLGGGRVHDFVRRLEGYRTLHDYAADHGWDYGEGVIEGASGEGTFAPHIVGFPLLRSQALTTSGIDESQIQPAPKKRYKTALTPRRFTPPMLLIKEHQDIASAVWTKEYLVYTQRIVGFCASRGESGELRRIRKWLTEHDTAIKAYVAATSPCLYTQKATAIQADDIYSIPYPGNGSLELSQNEELLAQDIVDYYRDLVRLGEDSRVMAATGHEALAEFCNIFVRQIAAVYSDVPVQALPAQWWPGVICQPFGFGLGTADWDGADSLKGKLDTVLRKRSGSSLHVTRIARIYDGGNFFFLLKPDRLRYWLRSIALRDADETLADLRAQGF